MLRDFHVNEIFIKILNATFLVLIPKKGDVEGLKDFRPISLLIKSWQRCWLTV